MSDPGTLLMTPEQPQPQNSVLAASRDLSPGQVMDFFNQVLGKDTLNSWSAAVFKNSKKGKGSRDRKFNPQQIREIAVLMDQAKAAKALDKYRKACEASFQAAERWAQSLESLFSACLSPASPLDPAAPLSGALREMAVNATHLMPAEYVAILLQPDPSSAELQIVADSRKIGSVPQVGFRLTKGAGWTWQAFKTRKILNRFGPELDAPPGNQVGHLPARTSFLAVPLFDAKRRAVGVLKMDNKKAPGEAWPHVFTPDDEIKASLLATQISLMLEIRSVFAAAFEMMKRVGDQTGFIAIANLAIDKAVSLTKADLGEISLQEDLDAKHFDLHVAVTCGNNKLDQGEPVKEPSITSSVLKTGVYRIIPNVKDVDNVRDYLECNGDDANPILSEAAFPISTPGRIRGVINVESTSLGDEGGLNHYDRPVMELVSRITSLGQRITGVQAAVAKQLISGAESEWVLQKMLLRVVRLSESRFKFGIGYRADYHEGILRAICWQGCPHEPFQVDFHNEDDGERYAAAKVVKSGKPFFCRYPKNDKNVHQKGLEAFAISGSLLALPVGFLDSAVPLVGAVLVLWTGGEALRPESVSDQTIDLEAAELMKFTTLRVCPAIV
jgi:hypothetical protein